MQMPMTAEDIVVSIFYCIKVNNLTRVTADRERLHKAFFDAKKKYPKVMRLFTFREREVFPESAQLDQALSNLDATGVISRQNLAPRYYQFERPLESNYDKFSKGILAKAGIGEQEIKSLACDLLEPLTAEKPE